MGVSVQSYQSDNGIIASSDFMDKVNKGLQNIMFSKVGGHHQNGIAERGIQSILTNAETLLIHAAIHWTDTTNKCICPRRWIMHFIIITTYHDQQRE